MKMSNVLKLDRWFTLGALMRKGVQMPFIYLAICLMRMVVQLVTSGSVQQFSIWAAGSSLLGAALLFAVYKMLMAPAGRFSKGVRPVNIHWTNTPDGVQRTDQHGYSQGSWDGAPFATDAVQSRKPLWVLQLSARALGLLALAVGLLPAAVFQLFYVDQGEQMSVMFAGFAFGLLVCSVLIALLALGLYRSFVRKYCIDGSLSLQLLPAVIALGHRSPVFLDKTSGRARSCVEMNGHVRAHFYFDQPNGAAGDRY